MRKKLAILLFAVFFVGFCVSGYVVCRYYREDKTQKDQYEKLIDTVKDVQDSSAVTEKNENTVLPEYAPLLQQNSDLIGWIQIEDTQINYPVMQSVDNPDFYLKHLFDKTYSDYGCPYVEEMCDVLKPSDNIIIYSHHMKSDKMFSQLEKYKEKKFWEEHKYINFNTLYERQMYEIVAAFKTVVYTDDPDMFKYYEFIDAQSPGDFNEYINRAKQMSEYDTGVTASYGDKLITLSTCEFSNTNGRFVVVAKKIG